MEIKHWKSKNIYIFKIQMKKKKEKISSLPNFVSFARLE